MPRIRTIKPSFFKNEELAELTMPARLLFIGLWCLADKEGRLEDRPKRIKAELFPYDTIEIDQQLSRLQSAGFILRYLVPITGVGELKVIQIINFLKHQRITGSEVESKSEFPAPDTEGNTLETTRKQQGNNLDDRKGKEGKGYIGKDIGKGEESANAPPVRPDENLLTNYFVEIGLDDFSAQAQANLFLDHYSSNGWKVGKNPMKDWRAAARGWKQRINDFKPPTNGTHKQSTTAAKVGRSERNDEARANY